MAGKRKSIIDDALLESEQIEKAFEANAKEVLTRTMSSEIEEMVKESLEDSIGLTEDDDMEDEMDLELDLDVEDGEIDDMEMDIDAGGAGEDDLDLGDMGDLDLDLDVEDGDVDVVDLTDADQSEVIRVFKKMGPDDEIEVVQDGNSVDIKDTETGAEYRVELGDEMGDMEDMGDLEGLDGDMGDLEDLDIDMDDMGDLDLDAELGDLDDDMGGDNVDIDIDMDDSDEDDDLEEGVIYEIEIEIDDEEDGEINEEDEEEEETVEEDLARTRGRASQGNRYSGASHLPKSKKNESVNPRNSKLIKENKVLKHNFSKVRTENEQLKEDYNNMVGALKQFRNKLNEVAVFNSNLTYSVRLFTENTTTKEEKLDIIKRFDDVKSLKESKNVYKQLVNEISKATPIKESVEEKLNETKTSGSSTKMNESKVYVNPELEKMKKLWSYEYKN
jgi:hypothetical protein